MRSVRLTPTRAPRRRGPGIVPWSTSPKPMTGSRSPGTGVCRLNPPFLRYEVGRWIQRLAEHGHGTALLHARTETEWFLPIWRSASGILFMADRIHFHRPDGSRQPANSGAPPVLVSFGERDLARLRDSGIAGALVTDWDIEPSPAAEVHSWADIKSAARFNRGAAASAQREIEMDTNMIALLDAVVSTLCVDTSGSSHIGEAAMVKCATEILTQVRAARELAELHGWADWQLHQISNPK